MTGKRGGEGWEVDLGPLSRSLGYALRRAQLTVFQDFYATMAPVGLRPTEFSVLLVVGRNPGLQQNQVADALGIQPPNFAMLVGRLVARGLAERRASATDRRAVALHLTEEGEAVLSRGMALQESHERNLGERLGEGRRQELLRLLRELF